MRQFCLEQKYNGKETNAWKTGRTRNVNVQIFGYRIAKLLWVDQIHNNEIIQMLKIAYHQTASGSLTTSTDQGKGVSSHIP
jgi:hypothetical protein